MLRYINREEYAIFVIAADLTLWLGLLKVGLPSSLAVNAAQLTGRPDQEELNRLTSTVFFAQLVISAVVVVFGVGLAVLLPWFFRIEGDLARSAVILAAILVFSVAVRMVVNIYSVLLTAHQMVHVERALGLGRTVTQTVTIVVLLPLGFGLSALGFGALAGTGAVGVLTKWQTHRRLAKIRIRSRLFSWSVLKDVMATGWWLNLGALAGLTIINLDRIVAGRLVSLASVTTLVLTGKLYLLAYALLQRVTSIARPGLGQLFGSGDVKRAYDVYKALFLISTGGAIVVAASICSANGAFVPWWVGGANYGGPRLDAVLAINLVVHCWVLPSRAALWANKAVKRQSLSRVTEGVLNLVLSILLGFRFGLVGIVAATAISGLVTSNWILPLLSARMFGISFRLWLRQELFPIIVLLAVLAPVVMVCRSLAIQIGGLAGASAGGGVCGILGLGFLWFFVFDDKLRKRFRSEIAQNPA